MAGKIKEIISVSTTRFNELPNKIIEHIHGHSDDDVEIQYQSVHGSLHNALIIIREK